MFSSQKMYLSANLRKHETPKMGGFYTIKAFLICSFKYKIKSIESKSRRDMLIYLNIKIVFRNISLKKMKECTQEIKELRTNLYATRCKH